MAEKTDNAVPQAAPAASASVEVTGASEMTLRHPDWKRRLKDDAQRDTVTNAREYVKTPDRANPMHNLYEVINKLAAMLDEAELENKALRERR